MQRFKDILKSEKYIILFLILLSMFRALHEISKFRIDWSWIPSWGYPFGITTPPFDSYHVYGGLFTLTMIAGLRLTIRSSKNMWWENILIAAGQFVIYFYTFDWFYHVIFMLPEYMEFQYVVPFLSFIQELF